MELFPRSFLLVFAQLSVGGFLALSIPPFHEIERGFYKSTAFVYLLMALLCGIGSGALMMRAQHTSSGAVIELLLWGLYIIAASAYVATLWGDRAGLRARLFVATWSLGLLALLVASQSYRSAPLLSLETVYYTISFWISALLLGAVTAGMLLGHWYLIDQDLSLDPFRAMLRFYTGCLVAQTAVSVAALLALLVAGSPASADGVARLFSEHRALLAIRMAASPLGAGVLAVMIRRTLLIPQTMAATGLFYIAILAVAIGEFLGRFILFRTGLPL